MAIAMNLSLISSLNPFIHQDVNEDGTLKDDSGSVTTKGRISKSDPNGGCGAGECNCSSGHWICVVHPRTQEGIVSGFNLKFNSEKNLNQFLVSSPEFTLPEFWSPSDKTFTFWELIKSNKIKS